MADMTPHPGDFFETDEPIDKIVADYWSGEKVVTGPAEPSVTEYLNMPLHSSGEATAPFANVTTQELISH